MSESVSPFGERGDSLPPGSKKVNNMCEKTEFEATISKCERELDSATDDSERAYLSEYLHNLKVFYFKKYGF